MPRNLSWIVYNMEMPQDLKDFIKNSQWTFASTMADIPHWYIVRKTNNYELFVKLVKYIRLNGVCRRWFNRVGMYLDYEGHSYWTMGNPIAETTIINRKVINSADKNSELPLEYCQRERDDLPKEEDVQKLKEQKVQKKLF